MATYETPLILCRPSADLNLNPNIENTRHLPNAGSTSVHRLRRSMVKINECLGQGLRVRRAGIFHPGLLINTAMRNAFIHQKG